MLHHWTIQILTLIADLSVLCVNVKYLFVLLQLCSFSDLCLRAIKSYI